MLIYLFFFLQLRLVLESRGDTCLVLATRIGLRSLSNFRVSIPLPPINGCHSFETFQMNVPTTHIGGRGMESGKMGHGIGDPNPSNRARGEVLEGYRNQ